MPDVKVYVRQSNLDKWNSIHNKSEWLNTLLANSDDTSEYGKTKETPVGPMITVLAETLPNTTVGFTPKAPNPETGYPCCTKAKPCKHWQWDTDQGAYINSLTGEVKEAI